MGVTCVDLAHSRSRTALKSRIGSREISWGAVTEVVFASSCASNLHRSYCLGEVCYCIYSQIGWPPSWLGTLGKNLFGLKTVAPVVIELSLGHFFSSSCKTKHLTCIRINTADCLSCNTHHLKHVHRCLACGGVSNVARWSRSSGASV